MEYYVDRSGYSPRERKRQKITTIHDTSSGTVFTLHLESDFDENPQGIINCSEVQVEGFHYGGNSGFRYSNSYVDPDRVVPYTPSQRTPLKTLQDLHQLAQKLLSQSSKEGAELWGWSRVPTLQGLSDWLTKDRKEELRTAGDTTRVFAIHMVMLIDPNTAITLIDDLEDSWSCIEPLLKIENKLGLNTGTIALLSDDPKRLLSRVLDGTGLYELLVKANENGATPLHWLASFLTNERKGLHFRETIFEPVSFEHLNKLLRNQDSDGLSVLARCIQYRNQRMFLWIIQLYKNSPALLLELAALKDVGGDSAFSFAIKHSNNFFIKSLISSTSLFQNQQRFAQALEKVVVRRRNFELSRNLKICQWALGCVNKRQYLLFDTPKVIIISNETNRDDAGKEADELKMCFTNLKYRDIDYEMNLPRKKLMSLIKNSSKNENGLIVAVMSHGFDGYIEDGEGENIAISEIEDWMTYHSPENVPKCLIVQACQNWSAADAAQCSTTDIESNENVELVHKAGVSSQEDPKPAPRSKVGTDPGAHQSRRTGKKDFILLMAAAPGYTCKRNDFISALSQAISKLRVNEDIIYAMNEAMTDVMTNNRDARPQYSSTTSRKFCLKNVLSLVYPSEEDEN